MKRKLISWILALSLLMTLVPVLQVSAAVGSEVNVDRIVAATEEFMIGTEGKYDSVFCNDSGAVSIGKLQWHGIRALGLMKLIVQKNPEQAKNFLGNSLYNEIVNSALSAWKRRSVSRDEADKLSKALGSDEGIKAQDELAYDDISAYVKQGYALNIHSDAALMYYCDIENQYGIGNAKKVVDYAFAALGRSRTSGSTINSIDEFHTALLNSSASLVQNYISRRKKTYSFITKLNWENYGASACENCPSTKFWDVPGSSSWAHEGIDFVLKNGLFTGVSEHSFAPSSTMTRAMLVTVLYRLDGQPEAAAENPFTDVAAEQWFAKAVIWAAENGIVKGTSEDTFEPDTEVSREQIAEILYRYTSAKRYELAAGGSLDSYHDSKKVSEYAQAAIAWATAEQLISGEKNNGTLSLNPTGDATRAQVATILMRYVERFAVN